MLAAYELYQQVAGATRRQLAGMPRRILVEVAGFFVGPLMTDRIDASGRRPVINGLTRRLKLRAFLLAASNCATKKPAEKHKPPKTTSPMVLFGNVSRPAWLGADVG